MHYVTGHIPREDYFTFLARVNANSFLPIEKHTVHNVKKRRKFKRAEMILKEAGKLSPDQLQLLLESLK